MTLTPDEIVNYPLKQAVRGYSVKQVDELLDQVADALERARVETDELRERLMSTEQRLASASETEATLKRTLVTAQRAAEQSLEEAETRAAELVDDARRESASIVEQAKLESEELRLEAVQTARAEEAEARRRRQALEQHIEELRNYERDFRGRLRSLLDEQLRLLEEVQTGPPAPAPQDGPEEASSPFSEEGMEPETSNIESSPREPEDVPRPDDRALRVRVRDPDHGRGSDDADDGDDVLFSGADGAQVWGPNERSPADRGQEAADD